MKTATNQIPDEKNREAFVTVDALLQNIQKERVLICIAGAGGAGKTTFAKNLSHYLTNSCSIDLDDYLLSREERGKLEATGYNPVANRLELAHQHLHALSQGISILKPVYSHKIGKVLPDAETVAAQPIVIAEGVTALYPELNASHDIGIFLDAPAETQIKSRIERDVNERGYSREEAMALFNRIQPDHQRFVMPSMQRADLVFRVSLEYVLTETFRSDRTRTI